MQSTLNPVLFQLAMSKTASHTKSAAVPAGGGAPPMDPAAGGMAPAGGGMPPMDPAAGGMMQPPAGPPGGMPQPSGMPMDPSMMGGAPPMGGMPMGGMPAQAGQAAGPPKMDQKQQMQAIDYRLYNMQQMLSALMNHLQVSVPPGALITPPGSPIPVAEAAVPGGPQDPTMQQQQQPPAGGGGQSAIPPIQAMQGASPEMAAMGGDMGKQGMQDLLAASSMDIATEAVRYLLGNKS